MLIDMKEQTNKLVRCSLPRRLAAMIYDALIVIGLLIIAGAFASLVGAGKYQAFRDPTFTAYLIIVWFFYFALLWRSGGMTVGMRAWRVKIVPDEGDHLTWKACLTRFVTAFFSTAVLGLGLFWSFFEPQKRCWHDLTSRTGLYVTPKP